MARRRPPTNEASVGSRIKQVRELLQVTQSAFASGVGLKRERLASYENGRASVPCDVALRLCRHWIVSEEWLATGRFDAFHEAAKVPDSESPNGQSPLYVFAIRHCVDLLSDPISRQVPPGMRYFEAYEAILFRRYRELVKEFPYQPRVIVTDDDTSDLLSHYVTCIFERWLLMVPSLAEKDGAKAFMAQRMFTRVLKEAGDFLLSRISQAGSEPPDFLKLLVNDPNRVLWLAASRDLDSHEREIQTKVAAPKA